MGEFEVRCARGRAALRKGRFAEAVKAYRAAIDADPQSLKARVDLSIALRRCRKPKSIGWIAVSLRTAIFLRTWFHILPFDYRI